MCTYWTERVDRPVQDGDSPLPASGLPALPPGFELEERLASSERGHVLRARHAGESWVLRLAASPGAAPADALMAQLAALGTGRGVALPAAWGRTDAGLPWTARPFVAGRPLDAALREAAPRDAARLLAELLETLAELHEAGLLHRDLKADNLLLGPDGPLILDLDLLGGADAAAAGSPDHLAPELLLGRRATPASDLFALGASLAYTWCGPPAASFRRAFPARPFWDAAQLDPARVPEPLRALVRALVRRHPADRPASARAAARLLGAARRVPPERQLPFAAGREQALARMLDELRVQPRVPRELVLLRVEDPGESDELLALVELHLALHERAVRRLRVEGDPHSALAEAFATPGEALLDGVALADEHGAPAVERVARAFLDEPEGPSARWWMTVSAARAESLVAALDAVEPGATLRALDWPVPTPEQLAAHLDRLADGAAPDVARRLGASLHALTGGRRAALREALRRAPEQGVLREDEGRWTLLLDAWPADAEPAGRLDAAWDELDDPAVRRALAVLAAWDAPLAPDPLASAADAPDDALAQVLARLREAGLLDPELRLHEGVAWRAGLAPHVLRLAGESVARDAHARCLARLDQPSPASDGERSPSDATAPDGPARHAATLARRARHALGAAADAEALAEACALAEALLDAGGLAAARRLAGALAEHPLALADPALSARVRLLTARVELSQARADRALQVLDEAGLLGDDASPAAWLVGAQAAEYLGRRERARELNQRVLASTAASSDQQLHARVGLANAALLDGDPREVLRLADVELPAAADPEAAARLLDLQGVAHLRGGALDDADAAFAAAREHALRARSPLALARTELNRAQLDRRRARHGAAVEALLRSAEAYSRAGHARGRARALNNLGVVLGDRGEAARALRELRAALALRRRVGDEHGAALSLAALGVVQLESGELGAARESLAAAREVFAERGYARELQLVEVYAGLLGALLDATPTDPSPEAAAALGDRPGLVERARAAARAARGEHDEAVAAARAALDAARAAHDAGESWRAAWLLAALDPRDGAARDALGAAAEALGGPVRAAELRWCVERPSSARALGALLAEFEAAGQHERTWACAEELRAACEREGDDPGRRRAAARVAAATETLTDGLSASERERALARLRSLQPAPAAVPEEDDPVQVRWLLACNRRMAVEDDLEGLLLSIVDMALEVSGARRGLLVLLAGDGVDVQVARNMDHEDVSDEELQFSRTVVREAVQGGRAVVTTDAAADARFAGAASLASLSTRAVLCVPLPGGPSLAGALYLDDDSRRVPFDDTDVQRVEALADQAQLAILNLRRRAEIERLNARLAERVDFQEQELVRARSALRKRGRVAPVGGLVGESEAMQKLYALIERVGPTQLSVLVTGPSGAGKDLVARALHERSDRADGPLIIENVAAVPANLLESELFGHVRGTFTGADRDRRGLLAEADGGTFVLDEIGELPMELQPKLLRALETGEVRPLGGRTPVKVDVRFVAATHRDLLERVRAGEFREDLYYRLNAMEIRVPSLTERLADVPLLARHFLERLNREHDTTKRFDDAVLRALVQRTWPGEVRELANEVARLYFLSGDVIDDPGLVREPARSAGDGGRAPAASLRLEDLERDAIRRALDAADGRKDRAAELLGISRAGLYTKIKRLDIDPSKPDDG